MNCCDILLQGLLKFPGTSLGRKHPRVPEGFATLPGCCGYSPACSQILRYTATFAISLTKLAQLTIWTGTQSSNAKYNMQVANLLMNFEKEWKLTYCDLDPRGSWKSNDVSSRQFGSKWAMLTDSQQPSPPYPGTPPLLHAPAAYHHLVVPRAYGSTGVFHNISPDLNYWHSTLLKEHPAFAFTFCMTFCTSFCKISLPKNVPLIAENWNPLLNFLFNNLFLLCF